MTDYLGGLFLAAFAAATLLPAQSELALGGLLAAGHGPVWLFVGTATLGNTLGSVVNWLLGRGCLHFAGRAWFPVRPETLAQATGWYQRYGRWSLLLSWMPVIGDPLTLAAGLLRERFSIFILLVSVAKLGRYLVVAALALHWFGPS
ncbi:MAG: DedA family protein [Desulfovibrio sp.]|nr:DedA family protein [Desulfovibrio sp.]